MPPYPSSNCAVGENAQNGAPGHRPGIASCGSTESLESACAKSTRGIERGHQAAWRMRRRSLGAHPRLLLQWWRLQLTPCLLLRAPLRRAGPSQPAAARLLRHFLIGVRSLCSRMERGAGRQARPLPLLGSCQLILRQRIHTRGREEEGDDGGVAMQCRHMQRGHTNLQWRGRGRRGRDVRSRGNEERRKRGAQGSNERSR